MSKPIDVFQAPLEGTSLVEASAGTGKTYTIESLYVRMIIEKNLEPSQLLVMTFTEAATAELKLRLRNRLKSSLDALQTGEAGDDSFLKQLLNQPYSNATEKLEKAIETFDEAAVFTIHGFCTRLLTEYSIQFEVPANFELLTDESELLQDVIDDYWRACLLDAGDTEEQQFLLNFLTDIGFGPDELQSVLKKVLNHPNAKVEPSELSTGRLLEKIGEWNEVFNQAKAVWENEKEAFEEVYFEGDLNGNAFQKSKRKPDWEILQEWLNSDEPTIQISDRLHRFGSYMKERGSKKSYQVPHFQFFEIMDAFIELTEQFKLLKPAFIKESITFVKQKFKEIKERRNYISYNGLLELVEKGLRNDSSGKLSKTISQKYPIGLVDEFQDTDPIQYGILRHLYHQNPETALFMIGDPKQAIYSFRGADIFTYLAARSDVSENQSYHLKENYRSNKGLIEGVNELFSTSSNPFLIEKLSFNQVEFPASKTDDKQLINDTGEAVTPLQFRLIEKEKPSPKNAVTDDVYNGVCNEISELLSGSYSIDGKNVQEKDIAVLVRNLYQGEDIQAALRKRGIKSVLKSRTSVFATKEAEELFRILSAVYKISYEAGIRTALATNLLGFSAEEILAVSESEKEWASLVHHFSIIKEKWEFKGIEAAINELIVRFDVQQKIAMRKNAERRTANLFHLSELLSKAQREHQFYGKTLLKWFFERLNQDSSGSDEEELRLESDEDLVQISTIHASKGLQYPIVFAPFLWEDTSKPQKPESAKVFSFYQDRNIHIDISKGLNHPKKQAFIDTAHVQEMAEEVRLAYVALTRAVSACYVFVPCYKALEFSPLGSILQSNQKRPNFELVKEKLASFNYAEVHPFREESSVIQARSDLDSKDLRALDFSRNDLYQYPRMLSYTLLSKSVKGDSDNRFADEMIDFNTEESTGLNQFGFPKGADAGSCLHQVFEDVSFSSPQNLQEIVTENLAYYSFDEEWQDVVHQWIIKSLRHPFGTSELSLSMLSEKEVLKEMEFFFPVHNLAAEPLWKLIRKETDFGINAEQLSGFMKGFIDLIFKYEGKFYILDYKSNHLGNSFEDYAQPQLSQAVTEAGFDLQYHIYTLALHRFLKQKLPDYNYEQHFGGVFYYFLRGVNPEEPGSGLFFDKPDWELIKSMDEYVKKGDA